MGTSDDNGPYWNTSRGHYQEWAGEGSNLRRRYTGRFTVCSH